jgi:RNA polymerase sigma-70 factor, ECF subfamily
VVRNPRESGKARGGCWKWWGLAGDQNLDGQRWAVHRPGRNNENLTRSETDNRGSKDMSERGKHPEQLFGTYVIPELEALLRLALALTYQHADAEDLVQDTLLRAYRSIEHFDGEHPRAWLFTIMRHNHANNHRRRRPEWPDDPETLTRLVDNGTSNLENPEERFTGGTFDETVEAAFLALPPTFQDAVRLVDVGGLSYAEAAQVLDVPTGTLTSRLHRARSHIRQRLTARSSLALQKEPQ